MEFQDQIPEGLNDEEKAEAEEVAEQMRKAKARANGVMQKARERREREKQERRAEDGGAATAAGAAGSTAEALALAALARSEGTDEMLDVSVGKRKCAEQLLADANKAAETAAEKAKVARKRV